MSRAARILPWVLAALLLGCSPDSGSPEGAVKLMLRAVAMRDNAKVYALLGPATQRRLQGWADRATHQTGGRRRFKPEELLAPSLDQPRQRISRYETLSVAGDRARVKVVDSQAKRHEVFELVRVQGKWRIELPASAFTPPAPPPKLVPTSKPSTRVASRPAAPSSAPAGSPPASQVAPAPTSAPAAR